MMEDQQLVINKEFHELIPPLAPEEYKQLEANILAEGCRDALVAWNGVIVDGHNRYEICSKHNIPFTTKEMVFKDRDEAKEWIIRNQFGRRNLSPYERSKLVLKLKEIIAAKAKERQRTSTGGSSPQLRQISAKAEKIETREELAKAAGVSHDTIDKVHIIEQNATPEQKKRLSTGRASINKIYDEIKSSKPKPKPQQPPDSPKEEQIINNDPIDEPQEKGATLISIRHIQMLVNHFLVEATPYTMMRDQVLLLKNEDREQILKEILPIEKWLQDFRKAIKIKEELV